MGIADELAPDLPLGIFCEEVLDEVEDVGKDDLEETVSGGNCVVRTGFVVPISSRMSGTSSSSSSEATDSALV